MRQLRELVELTQADSSLNDLASPDSDSILGKLYRAILSGSEVGEEDIVKVVYGPEVTPSYSAYQKLKSRLRNILLDALLNVNMKDKPNYSTYLDTYRTLQRQYASAQLLLSMRAYNNCAHVLERVYRMATKNRMAELQYQSSQMLMGLYLGVVYNPRKFDFHVKMSALHREEFADYGKVSSALYVFKHHLYNRIGSNLEIANVAEEQAQTVKEIMDRHPDFFQIKGTYFDIITWVNYLRGEFLQAVEFAQAGEKHIQEVQLGAGSRLFAFRIMQLRAFGFLNDLVSGELIIKRIESEMEPYTVNWLSLQEEKIFFYLRLQQYERAFGIAQSVDRRQVRKILSQRLRQLWELIDALMHLLYLCGQIPETDENNKFRLSRFLNSMPTFSKEKRGMNVQVLIIHTMLLIVLKRYDEVIDRVEALEKYCSRYLSNNDHLRSNCFIKMLTSIVKGNFHQAAAVRYATPYLKKLRATEQDLLGQVDRTEIVAYEDLWGIILQHLGTKIYRRPKTRTAG